MRCLFRESAAHRHQSVHRARSVPGRIGDYEILVEIARGGMGIVYRARQLSVDRSVALKMIVSGEFASRDALDRFFFEAKAAASLDHPNIVPLYEAGEWEGQPFFSMKFIEGGSLSSWLAEHKPALGSRWAAELIAKLARAVHYAHQRGILHRDIKPGNILLGSDGEPHLTDFGLARPVEKGISLTHSMAILGTPSYISPEQARGDKELTTAVDVYGLGAVLYELLTGQPPFLAATTFETVRQVIEAEPRHPTTLRRQVDRDLATICLKCLNKEPNRRYGSAQALAQDLQRWLEQKPIEARRTTRLERTWLWCMRHPPLATLLGVTLLALVALIVTLALSNIHIRAANQKTERLADESRLRLIDLNVAAGNRQISDGDWFGALPWFMEALALEHGNQLREDIHRRRIGTVLRMAPVLEQLFIHSNIIASAAFNFDASQIFTICDDRLLRVFDVTSGRSAFPALVHPGGLNQAWFSANGRRLISVGRDNSLRAWNTQTGAAASEPILLPAGASGRCVNSTDGRWLATPQPGGVQLFDTELMTSNSIVWESSGAPLRTNFPWLVQFSPDNNSLALGGEPDRLRFWDLATRKPARSTFVLGHRPFERVPLGFDGTGQRLATTLWESPDKSEDFLVQLWDITSGLPIAAPMLHPSAIYSVDFRPHHETIATGCWDGVARIWNSTNGQLLASLPHGTALRKVLYTPDGLRLITTTWDGCIRVWNPDSGQTVLPLIRHNGFSASAELSPDGNRLLTSARDSAVRLWRLPPARPARLTLRPTYEVRRARFSPDGKLVLTAGGQTADLWNPVNGELIHQFKHPTWVNDAEFSPDGRTLVTGSEDGTARIWNVKTGELRLLSARHSKKIQQVVFSSDGTRFATASFDGSAMIWKTSDGTVVLPPLQHGGEVNAVALSPDGRQVATGGNDELVRLWDLKTGARLGEPLTNRGQVNSLQFSPDSRRLLSAAGSRAVQPLAAHLWNLDATPPVDLPLPHIDGVWAAEFSPDGRRVATAGEDNCAQIWDAATGQRLTPALRHKGFVYHSFFSPDGRMLLTVSEDSTAMVWDAATGEPITPPLRHEARIPFGGWSPDGREVITCGPDNTASIWDVSPSVRSSTHLQALAELLSGHRLQPAIGILPLNAEEMKTRWDLLREKAQP